MLTIGNTYLIHKDGQTRLCADLTLNGKGITLWFGVDTVKEAYLCTERSDAFVMALLPTAMRGGYDIVFQTPMSERLHYQLSHYLIPAVCDAGDLYHPIKLIGPLTSQRIANRGGVGTGFSGGVDSLYSIMRHGEDSAYPLTHLAVFNVGAFDGSDYQKNFRNACDDANTFAQEQNFDLVCLDSNIVDVLPENFLEVYSFRNLAGALILQNLFCVYLLSSDQAFSDFTFNFSNNGTYDLLVVHCAQTESLAVYSSGGQVHRHQKLEALANWEPAHRWLHPCFRQRLRRGNCGQCKKCIHTMTVLYAYGVLDRFQSVFDVEAYKKSLSQNIGYLLTMQDKSFCEEAIEVLRERNIPIPVQAYAEAEKLQKRGRTTANTQTEQADTLRALAQRLRKANNKNKC